MENSDINLEYPYENNTSLDTETSPIMNLNSTDMQEVAKEYELWGDKLNSTNPKDLLGLKKVPMSLVPATSIIYEAMAFVDGANKYGPYNWRKKSVKASIYIDAAMRHLNSWYNGEEKTRDSKIHHLACAKASLGIIIDAMETGNLVDDRPLKADVSGLLERFEDDVKRLSEKIHD